ncbi:MAG: YggT family protein [Anaerolineales bacterium]
MEILIILINTVQQILVVLVFVSIILSFFMDPYHPVRRGVDNIVQPMLSPIRRVVPLVGMFDFSPLILILLLQFAGRILIAFIVSLR